MMTAMMMMSITTPVIIMMSMTTPPMIMLPLPLKLTVIKTVFRKPVFER